MQCVYVKMLVGLTACVCVQVVLVWYEAAVPQALAVKQLWALCHLLPQTEWKGNLEPS